MLLLVSCNRTRKRTGFVFWKGHPQLASPFAEQIYVASAQAPMHCQNRQPGQK
jgi:hypothetical protein